MKTKTIIWLVVVVIAVVIIGGWYLGTGGELTCSGSTPNKCNDQCWSSCEANQIFTCEVSGGMCGADPNNCPASAPHSCGGKCWACGAGEKFICDQSQGGTCQKI